MSISKHSTSIQVVYLNCLIQTIQTKNHEYNIFSVNKSIAYPHLSLAGT